QPSKRIRERLDLKLPVRVRCRETTDFEWEEITRLMNVTPFGAGFRLKRPVEVGRLLHMTIPMPRQLRVFDHVEDQYRIWALVRNVRPVVSSIENTSSFDIGVAFVGKRPPKSYLHEPAKRYEVAQSVLDTISEDAEGMVKPLAAEQERATRPKIPREMLLDTLDEKGPCRASESTVTENISERGATLFTSFDLVPGRFIRITGQQLTV